MVGILTHWADLFDEPFGDSSGVPTFLVSRVARESVKVALSADGGDELFSGYHHYEVMLARERALARLPRLARDALSHTLQRVPPASLNDLMAWLPAPVSLRHAARREVVDASKNCRRCFRTPTRCALRPGPVALDAGGSRHCWARRCPAPRADGHKRASPIT